MQFDAAKTIRLGSRAFMSSHRSTIAFFGEQMAKKRLKMVQCLGYGAQMVLMKGSRSVSKSNATGRRRRSSLASITGQRSS
jgi:hypothetical protein